MDCVENDEFPESDQNKVEWDFKNNEVTITPSKPDDRKILVGNTLIDMSSLKIKIPFTVTYDKSQ